MLGYGILHSGSLGDSRLSILHFQVHWLPYLGIHGWYTLQGCSGAHEVSRVVAQAISFVVLVSSRSMNLGSRLGLVRRLSISFVDLVWLSFLTLAFMLAPERGLSCRVSYPNGRLIWCFILADWLIFFVFCLLNWMREILCVLTQGLRAQTQPHYTEHTGSCVVELGYTT